MDSIIFGLFFALTVLCLVIALFVRWLNKAPSQRITFLEAKVSALEGRIQQLEFKRIEPRSQAQTSAPVSPVIRAADPVAAPAFSAPAEMPPETFDPKPSFEPNAEPMVEPLRQRTVPELPKLPVLPVLPLVPSIFTNAKAWLLGGNTVARFGLLILFLGLSFLAKYAADNSLFPVEARLAVIGVIAIGLLVVGWRLRVTKPAYGLLLQGGAIAVLYLEIFAGYKFYGLLPGLVTFSLMMIVCAFATFLALRQNALVLALVASVGGFLTPILTSSGGGNFAGLFSIYAILNLGIFAIARYKSWRLLYLAGFILTFGVASLWALNKYIPSDFSVAIGFIVFFIALYSLIPVLEAKRAAPNIKHYVDGTLVFGTPTMGFGLLVKLVAHWEYGAAFAALGLGAWYLLLASMGLKKQVASLSAENQNSTALQGLKSAFVSYVALGAGFASLAIPLALDQRLAGIAWAVEGAALIWLGCRTSQSLTRFSGVLLQLVGFGIFFSKDLEINSPKPFLNTLWMGAMMLAVAMYVSAWLYRQWFARAASLSGDSSGDSLADLPKNRFGIWWQSVEPKLVNGFLIVATGLVLFSTSAELASVAGGDIDFSVLLAFWSLFSLGYAWLGKRLNWRLLGSIACLLLPIQVLFMLLQWFGFNASFEHWRWAAWPLSLGAMFFALRWQSAANSIGASKAAGWGFATHVWVAALLLAQLVQWLLRLYVKDEAWAIAGVGVLLSSLLLLFVRANRENLGDRLKHPLQAIAYQTIVPRGLAWFVGMWFVFACVSDYGGVAISPFIPLVNPIDLSATFALMSLFSFSRSLSFTELKVEPKYSQLALAAGAFLLLNTLLMRALSHYLSLHYSATAMMESATAQSAFSLLWALTATVIMFFASKKSIRSAWIVGAVLLGVVVVKLFLIDLSAISALTRIVSFVGVGLLMLLIGYLSPLPPAASTSESV
jgi:uncharacterized membrane protein